MKPERRPPARRGSARPPQRVRIIAGQYRRRLLPVADAPGLRPTPDRVRQTLFNWIAHLRPDLSQVRGLDLFAGSGALGFELASRGARRVVMVEQSPALVAQLRAVRDMLGAGAVDVRGGDALAQMRALAREAPAGFDLVFIDPPFDAGLHAPVLAALLPLLAPGALVYVESRDPLPPEAAAAGLVSLREMRAGQVRAVLLGRAAAADGICPDPRITE
jgi:16S rRNA (guanine(966)-N(2))-methyltransferase RsmD